MIRASRDWRCKRHFLGSAVLTMFCIGCGGGETTALLPQQIHGLPLTEAQSGEEAAAAIGSLHDDDVAPTESHIGYYGSEDLQVVVYVSRFGSEDEAEAQLAAMAQSIGSGSSGYGHHTHHDVAGTEVHSVFGHGQIHYFYARGSDLTWLATPPMLSRPALGELLGVAIDSIPGFGMPAIGEETPADSS